MHGCLCQNLIRKVVQMDDLISRKQAIDAIDKIESEIEDGEGFQYEKWRQYFCGLPSVQAEKEIKKND